VIGERRDRVLSLARKYGATNVRIFGSVARRQATGTSDLDLLIDPIPGRYKPVDLALTLAVLLGRRVDVVPEQALHWYVQPAVVSEAVPL
jgi:uncharacterized protein